MLRAHVPGICCSDSSPCVNWYCATAISGIFCPHHMLHSIQLVELHGKCHGHKISPKLLLHNNYQFLREDMSLQHIPGICTCKISVCKHMLWFCPCNFYPLCIPATCRLNAHNTSFLSLQHNPLCLPAFELFHKHWVKNIIGLKGKQFIINNSVATDTVFTHV